MSADRLLLAIICARAFGCASLSTFKEARSLEPGSFRFDVAGVSTTARPKSGATAFLRGARPDPSNDSEQARTFPALEMQLRYGVTDGFDLGLKTNLSSFEINGTMQIARGQRIDVALAPGLQGAIGTNGDDEGWSLTMLKLPLLVGLRFGSEGHHAFVLGPTLAKSWGSGTSKNSGYAIDALFAGGTIGLSFDGGSLRIMPEIAIYSALRGHGVALPGDVVRVSPDVGGGTPVLLQAGVAFAFGSGARAISSGW